MTDNGEEREKTKKLLVLGRKGGTIVYAGTMISHLRPSFGYLSGETKNESKQAPEAATGGA